MVILTSIDILSQDQIKWEEGSKAGRGIRNHYIYSSQVTLNSSFFKLSFPIKKMQFSKETILFSFTARINFKTQFCIQENLSQELDALS